jgi:solute carrier family 25 S-adenosylmethionine transporter 26
MISESKLWVFADGIIAGGVAGVIVETALYPIDTIKTRLQACQFY